MQSPSPCTFTITGMTGDACIQKVRDALTHVSGVTTEYVAVGRAMITCAYPATFRFACTAISSIGYRVSQLTTSPEVSTTVPRPMTRNYQTDHDGADVIGTIGPIQPQSVPVYLAAAKFMAPIAMAV